MELMACHLDIHPLPLTPMTLYRIIGQRDDNQAYGVTPIDLLRPLWGMRVFTPEHVQPLESSECDHSGAQTYGGGDGRLTSLPLRRLDRGQ